MSKECEKRGRYYHCRIENPDKFDPRSFRSKKVGAKGTIIVVGCPKGEYSPSEKRCRTGMRIQKKLKPV